MGSKPTVIERPHSALPYKDDSSNTSVLSSIHSQRKPNPDDDPLQHPIIDPTPQNRVPNYKPLVRTESGTVHHTTKDRYVFFTNHSSQLPAMSLTGPINTVPVIVEPPRKVWAAPSASTKDSISAILRLKEVLSDEGSAYTEEVTVGSSAVPPGSSFSSQSTASSLPSHVERLWGSPAIPPLSMPTQTSISEIT
eukprot:gnl/Dysnectes_brevis/2271_a2663_1492.p1 GENE.gnl/Dysnectes_brevis/2271_a2663_1492~~gnl/Dysnectes_brevis/2271_a2663_1492.p1  ORF type:complete len:194 (-),score=57.52 gnl/Dysnectes_brevis/2271_a2663_1492:224-805(-)